MVYPYLHASYQGINTINCLPIFFRFELKEKWIIFSKSSYKNDLYYFRCNIKTDEIERKKMHIKFLVCYLWTLPFLSDSKSEGEPFCDSSLRSKYCNASFGGEFHTGCKYCGIGPHCPSSKPSARGFDTRPGIFCFKFFEFR